MHLRLSRNASTLLVVGLVLPVACAHGRFEEGIDRTPTVVSGAGATILDPSYSAPAFPHVQPGLQTAPPGVMPNRRGPGGAPVPYAAAQPPGTQPPTAPYGTHPPGAPQGAYPPGAPAPPPTSAHPAPGGGGVVLFGGTQVDEERYRQVKEDPTYWKYLAAPFVVAAYPFKKTAELFESDEEPPPPTAAPRAAAPRPVADVHAADERARLEAMQRELAQRQHAAPAPSPGLETRVPASGARLSIAQELERLRQAQSGALAPTAPRQVASVRPPAPESGSAADRVVDRDGNGRPDHWTYRRGGKLAREVFDEDADGRPDRTLFYDSNTEVLSHSEEDTDLDGQLDAWAEYQNGKLHRRRLDRDGNGDVDTWTFYRAGALLRHEEDRNGDGFRDRVSHYRAGRLDREEEDLNGDGQADRITFFDDEERVRQREEDRNGDGLPDLRSHYVNGKLARREILSGSVDEALLPDERSFDEGR